MSVDVLDYVGILYEAHDGLYHCDDVDDMVRIAERLRALHPSHGLIPALEAKIARLEKSTRGDLIANRPRQRNFSQK